jgi:S1-C subfamily serine protease
VISTMNCDNSSTLVTLFCEQLNIEIQFNLNCGSFARMGAGVDMEVTVPISGVKDLELRLDRDATGHLIASDGDNTYLVTEETGLFLGPYYFALNSPPPVTAFLPEAVSAAPEIHQTSIPIVLSPGQAPWHGLGSKAKLVGLAFLAAVIFVAATVWTNGNPETRKKISRIETTEPTKATEEPIPSVPSKSLSEDTAPKVQSRQIEWSQIAELAEKSVFQLNVLNEHGQPYGLGTAFCIAPEGYLVTNAHVIKGSENFEAITAQGAKFNVKAVRYFDELHDLAVLEIDGRGLAGLKLAGDQPKVGEPVAAYGSPNGMQGSFSEGVVSALRPGSDLGAKQMGDLIQISAPISKGSSGSPVLNARGEVIGVATLLLKESQNLNFAVPISALKQLLETKPLLPDEFESREALAANPPFPAEEKLPESPAAASPAESITSDPEMEGFEQAKRASKWIEAFRIAKSLVAKYPESSTSHFQMGFAAAELSLYDVALRSFQESIAKNPESSASWNNLGIIYGRLRNDVEAEKAFARAAELNPSYSLSWGNLVRTRVINKKWREAGEALISLAQVDKSASEELLGDLIKNFGRPTPSGLTQMILNYRTRYPLATSDPEALGKKLVARFLSLGAGDSADAELRTYADIVEPYFGKAGKDAGDIYDDIIEYRRQWPSRSYDLTSFESAKLNSSKNLLTVRFSFQYQVAGNGKQRKGVIKQEMTFSRIADEYWVVTAVRSISN